MIAAAVVVKSVYYDLSVCLMNIILIEIVIEMLIDASIFFIILHLYFKF